MPTSLGCRKLKREHLFKEFNSVLHKESWGPGGCAGSNRVPPNSHPTRISACEFVWKEVFADIIK